MTLGHVYDLDLKRNELVIKDVIIQAQGEVNILVHCWPQSYPFQTARIGRICQASERSVVKLHIGPR